jgi:tRNA dimethylallyltransferase
MAPPAVPPQPALRQQFQQLGQPLSHALLGLADPVAGRRIAPADAVRTQRALEVLYATGRPASSQQGQVAPPWRILELALAPADLPARIQQRTGALYAEGLLEETAALLERYGPACPLLDTIGYGEARQVLTNRLGLPAARGLTERRTRQFAKRQRTWFRRQHQPLWLEGGPEDGDLLRQTLLATQAVLG